MNTCEHFQLIVAGQGLNILRSGFKKRVVPPADQATRITELRYVSITLYTTLTFCRILAALKPPCSSHYYTALLRSSQEQIVSSCANGMPTGFVSGGIIEEPTERDEEWLRAQQELEAERKRKAEEGKQAGGQSLFEILERNRGT